MATIDLSKLPPPKIVEELSFETIYTQRKAKLLELYPQAADTLALESEPLAYLLQENAYREVVWRQRVNEAAKGVMLAFAQGSDLDHIAANLNTQRLPQETDEALRQRAQNSFETLSVAGPRKQYETLAKAVSTELIDVSATSPSPANVVITLLGNSEDGSVSQTVQNQVNAALNSETVRPVADRITVQSANITPYSIEATLHIPKGPEAEPMVIAANQRLAEWLAKRTLGRSVYLSQLMNLLHVEGVAHVAIASPVADIPQNLTQYAHCTSVTISYEVEDD